MKWFWYYWYHGRRKSSCKLRVDVMEGGVLHCTNTHRHPMDFWTSTNLQDILMVHPHPSVLRCTPNLLFSLVLAPPLMDVENVPNAASEIIKRASGRGLSSFLIVCLKGVSSLHFRKLLSICVVYLTNSRTWKQLQRLLWTGSQSVFCQTNIHLVKKDCRTVTTDARLSTSHN